MKLNLCNYSFANSHKNLALETARIENMLKVDDLHSYVHIIVKSAECIQDNIHILHCIFLCNLNHLSEKFLIYII